MKRSQEKELLDAREIPKEALFRNLHELEVINSWLGGHALNRKALGLLLRGRKQGLHIVELGSGGGDNLRDLARYCRKRKVKARFTGIDLKPDCIEYAREHSRDFQEIGFRCCDYREYRPEKRADIAFSSLFCHHLDEQELYQYLNWLESNTREFFINDLHRHRLAEKSIALLTSLFSKSYLVKHDAPASVRRGFVRSDWKNMLASHNLEAQIYWKWAFRWMITGQVR